MRQNLTDRTAARSGAFTLLELLIAIAAVSLISLGIFQVFRATGETLRTGRRVSAFNAQASLLERQLRDDVERMTRDGFLMVRNQLTDPSGTGVALYRGQGQTFWRARRTDELVFFARGPFATRRDPVHPQRIAHSNEARIYIGHGTMRNPLDPDYYQRLSVSDDNSRAPRLGTGANQFAGEWTLLRQVMLLAKPREGMLDPLRPAPPITGEPGLNERADSDLQVDLQPAASSIFRLLAYENPPLGPTGAALSDADVVRDGSVERPGAASGIVDIATTDLAEIRAIILDAQNPALLVMPPPFRISSPPAFALDTNPAAPGSVTDIMQQWMIESLPADSDTDQRPRYERTPPDLLGAIGGTGTPFSKDYERTDQAMLTSSSLAIGCSEVIFEWSFGKRIGVGLPGEGKLIWHGLRREADSDGNGVLEVVANLYAGTTAAGGDGVYQVYRLANGTRALRPTVINRNIIHDQGTITQGTPRTAYSFFGYVDPTYNPPTPLNGEPVSMPWPWPKLLRATVRLVDQSDPSYEQTYQFIFELPGDQDAARQ